MSEKVRTGWASRDITPDRPVLLRGLFNLRVATRVNDPLTRVALAIESQEEQAIVVSVDACGIDGEVLAESREILSRARPELDGSKLVVSATHTHTAPFAGAKLTVLDVPDTADLGTAPEVQERYENETCTTIPGHRDARQSLRDGTAIRVTVQGHDP